MENNLEKLILEIETTGSQKITKKAKVELFELWLNPTLTEKLSGNIGAFFIRSILAHLNIDEHHVLKWRVENKYQQYRILNHYYPGCMADTIGFSELLDQADGRQRIEYYCENGYFIKACLGDSSGRLKTYDRTSELNDIISSYSNNSGNSEKWMLQQRLELEEEMRIHSFGEEVIDGLTFSITNEISTKSTECEAYVKKVIDKLPETIVNGSLIAWDVAITTSGEYYIIEANFTGYHEEYHPGFHTSGYFGDNLYGTILCAWVNNYFRLKFNVYINSIENFLLENHDFCKQFMVYNSIFHVGLLELIRSRRDGKNICGLMYLGTPYDSLFIRWLKFCQLQNFADAYFLITVEVPQLVFDDIIVGQNSVYTVDKHFLFSTEEYHQFQNLTYEERKETAYRKTSDLIQTECIKLC